MSNAKSHPVQSPPRKANVTAYTVMSSPTAYSNGDTVVSYNPPSESPSYYEGFSQYQSSAPSSSSYDADIVLNPRPEKFTFSRGEETSSSAIIVNVEDTLSAAVVSKIHVGSPVARPSHPEAQWARIASIPIRQVNTVSVPADYQPNKISELYTIRNGESVFVRINHYDASPKKKPSTVSEEEAPKPTIKDEQVEIRVAEQPRPSSFVVKEVVAHPLRPAPTVTYRAPSEDTVVIKSPLSEKKDVKVVQRVVEDEKPIITRKRPMVEPAMIEKLYQSLYTQLQEKIAGVHHLYEVVIQLERQVQQEEYDSIYSSVQQLWTKAHSMVKWRGQVSESDRRSRKVLMDEYEKLLCILDLVQDKMFDLKSGRNKEDLSLSNVVCKNPHVRKQSPSRRRPKHIRGVSFGASTIHENNDPQTADEPEPQIDNTTKFLNSANDRNALIAAYLNQGAQPARPPPIAPNGGWGARGGAPWMSQQSSPAGNNPQMQWSPQLPPHNNGGYQQHPQGPQIPQMQQNQQSQMQLGQMNQVGQTGQMGQMNQMGHHGQQPSWAQQGQQAQAAPWGQGGQWQRQSQGPYGLGMYDDQQGYPPTVTNAQLQAQAPTLTTQNFTNPLYQGQPDGQRSLSPRRSTFPGQQAQHSQQIQVPQQNQQQYRSSYGAPQWV